MSKFPIHLFGFLSDFKSSDSDIITKIEVQSAIYLALESYYYLFTLWRITLFFPHSCQSYMGLEHFIKSASAAAEEDSCGLCPIILGYALLDR